MPFPRFQVGNEGARVKECFYKECFLESEQNNVILKCRSFISFLLNYSTEDLIRCELVWKQFDKERSVETRMNLQSGIWQNSHWEDLVGNKNSKWPLNKLVYMHFLECSKDIDIDT